uniref:Uncharacterized protein n=1 Tax=Alexandrium monilatum TaxID=311494 RepID=A0A7S4T6C6_9DINO|mmetsp:Transcript_72712/g.229786  ORF Transcript_72712/g.229786 Transcript_72712/m.229786 type:complete len:238 (+) Transcript_72712:104-817(+)
MEQQGLGYELFVSCLPITTVGLVCGGAFALALPHSAVTLLWGMIGVLVAAPIALFRTIRQRILNQHMVPGKWMLLVHLWRIQLLLPFADEGAARECFNCIPLTRALFSPSLVEVDHRMSGNPIALRSLRLLACPRVEGMKDGSWMVVREERPRNVTFYALESEEAALAFFGNWGYPRILYKWEPLRSRHVLLRQAGLNPLALNNIRRHASKRTAEASSHGEGEAEERPSKRPRRADG